MSESGGRKIIVIYEKSSGKVKGVKMTGDIHRRRELSEACGGIPHGELGFTREPRGVEIDIENDTCKCVIKGEPLMLFGKDGLAKFQKVVIKEAREEIKKSEGIFIDPRSGLGDWILGAECAAGARELYQGKRVIIGGAAKYKELYDHLEAKFEWGGAWGDGAKFKGIYYVDQRVGYQFDPRGGNFGHVAKYGVYLGAEELKGRIKLIWGYGEREEYLKEIGTTERVMNRPILGIHIKSASSHTRSWNKKSANEVAEKWLSEYGGSVIFFAEKNKGEGYPERIWNIEPGIREIKLAAIIRECNILVCIDSGPLHLGRIQGVKEICLWGGTRPGIVLGRDIGENDIIGEGGCGYKGCHSCDKPKALCMEAIKVTDVWEKIKGVMYAERI